MKAKIDQFIEALEHRTGIPGAVEHFLNEEIPASSGWHQVFGSVAMFLMLFLMQRSQNKELSALHLKLNELIAATQHADNSLINIEELTERELSAVHDTHRQIIA